METHVRRLLAHVRRKFEEARTAQPSANSVDSHATIALNSIRELYLIDRALWDKDQPITTTHQVRVRAELSTRSSNGSRHGIRHSPQVLPQSLLGNAVHYVRSVVEARDVPHQGEVQLDNIVVVFDPRRKSAA